MNSACSRLAVCSTTHGAILFSVAAEPGDPPWPMAREEPIAVNTAIAAAAKNNEQDMRRHGKSVNRGFDFVILESLGNFLIFVFIGVSSLRFASFNRGIFSFHRSIQETEGEVLN